MPWDQTEELFKSALHAATGPSVDDDAWSTPTPKHEMVDLGEAGRQEIWEIGAARIEKLIAKHGGKQVPPVDKGNQGDGGLVARFGSSRSHLEIVDALGDHPRPTKVNPPKTPAWSALFFPNAPGCGKAQFSVSKTKHPGVRQRHRHRLEKGSKRTSTMTSSLRHAGTAANRTGLTTFF